ncbi:MAG: hypothetical protein ACLP59_19390 [Bryobacteraceae bacterium]
MLFETVRRARQRIVANETLRHSAYVTSAALGSLIVLLLAGTQILSWPWLLVLPAIAVVVGIYTTWRRAPSAYRAAQIVDRNLQLADTLSTALFFASRQGGGVQRTQWAQAERLAAGADLRRAIPIRMPRALYGSAILALLAGSLFALRYGLERRLDLRAPLASIVQDKLGYSETQEAKRERHPKGSRDPKQDKDRGFTRDDSAPQSPAELDAAQDAALQTAAVPNVDNSGRAGNSKLAQSTELESEQSKGNEPEGVGADPANQPSADGRKGPAPGKPGQKEGGQQGAGNAGENSGLLSKFRDAMSSLMNRVRPQQGAQNGGAQARQSGTPGQNGKQGQQPADARSGEGKEGQAGDENQDSQSAQSASAGQSGQQPASKQPGSGIGRQDGSKDVKLAEQLAAMGKISEIIGKRSANVTGELTVEVTNSNSQLRTPYAQREAQHTAAGGEINRDEVPAAYQAYVQQYFEQVRKQAASPAKAPVKRHTEVPKPGM